MKSRLTILFTAVTVIAVLATTPAAAAAPDLALISELTGMQASQTPVGEGWVYDAEHQVFLREPGARPTDLVPDPGLRELALAKLRTSGLLLIPDSTNKRIMTFDPLTGDLIDPNFMLLDNDATGTVIHAILGPSNNILVSDQTRDVVHNYDLSGVYLGVFAPAGGANTAILDNIRGIALRPNGNLLVTVAASANSNAIAEFDVAGNYIGNFVAIGSGGLNSPFDIYMREGTDWLVSGINSQMIHRYELNTGAYIGNLAPVPTFPQQILELDNGNVLVGNFSGTQGVYEFTAAGALVGITNPAGVSGYRGVWELANGNILTSTSGGVYEIDRNNNLIATKYTGQSRYIEFVVDWTVSIGDLPGDEEQPELPSALAIAKVAPNPFNPRTTVYFDVPRAGEVTLAIHDLRGRLVQTIAQGSLDSGRHQASWDGLDARGNAMPSGLYLVRLMTADGDVRTMKMTLAR